VKLLSLLSRAEQTKLPKLAELLDQLLKLAKPPGGLGWSDCTDRNRRFCCWFSGWLDWV
jgi:hypothetical protein